MTSNSALETFDSEEEEEEGECDSDGGEGGRRRRRLDRDVVGELRRSSSSSAGAAASSAARRRLSEAEDDYLSQSPEAFFHSRRATLDRFVASALESLSPSSSRAGSISTQGGAAAVGSRQGGDEDDDDDDDNFFLTEEEERERRLASRPAVQMEVCLEALPSTHEHFASPIVVAIDIGSSGVRCGAYFSSPSNPASSSPSPPVLTAVPNSDSKVAFRVVDPSTGHGDASRIVDAVEATLDNTLQRLRTLGGLPATSPASASPPSS